MSNALNSLQRHVKVVQASKQLGLAEFLSFPTTNILNTDQLVEINHTAPVKTSLA